LNLFQSLLNTENELLFVIFLIAGLYVLIKGGDTLIRGAESLSVSYNIDPFAIGLTVVAFGTSLPEFFVSFIGNLSGKDDIAIGNILGSNVANIALILGISAVMTPVIMDKVTMKYDLPITLAVSLTFYLFMFDGNITRINGIILTVMFGLYIYYVAWRARTFNEELLEEEIETNTSRIKDFVLILAGIVGLYIGSDLTIRGASGIARVLGVSELAIGLTIVSVGTSLPELVATIAAIRKNNHKIGVGNIIGSNVFNILFVLGLSSMVKPFAVNPDNIRFWGPLMLFATLLLFPLSYKKNKITKASGVFLLVFYSIYVFLSFLLKSSPTN
jgi:cation:H+ antiporter